MTLIEMLVAMTVFSIAVGMVFTAVVQAMRWSDETQQSAAASTELRNALAQVDRQVRSGNVLFSPREEDTWVSSCVDGPAADVNPSGTCMRVFTQANGDEKCVQWQVLPDGAAADGTPVHVLRSRSWATDWQSTGNVSTWAVVARDLTVDPARMPFTLLGASSPYKSRSLQVHLQSLDERQGEPVAIDSTLTGRNTTYGYDAGQCTPVPAA